MPVPTVIRSRVRRVKLLRPVLPADLVVRQRLLDALGESRTRPLTLLVAGAGFGKSTLLSAWAEQAPFPVAWLALERSDDEPLRLLDGLMAAIESVAPGACESTRSLLRLPEIPTLSMLGAHLADDLRALPTEIGLVIDDAHLATDHGSGDLLAGLTADHPAQLHLLAASRSEPSLNALRGIDPRVRATATVIREADLRFTDDETARFFAGTTHPASLDATLAAIVEPAEGWAAGLRLISLALPESPAGPPSRLAALDRGTIRGFLVDEVLALLPAEVVDFLTAVAVTERFDVRLAAHLLGSNGPAAGRMIRHAVDAHLFVVSLTDGWYRLHHLLRDALLKRLSGADGRERLRALHLRASAWHEAEGMIDEAITHALEADPDLAARIVERNADDAFAHDRWHEVETWIGRLPACRVRHNPALLTIKAYGLLDRGALEPAERALNAAQRLLDDDPSSVGHLPLATLTGDMSGAWADICALTGRDEEAYERAWAILRDLPRDRRYARANAVLYAGISLQESGDYEGAVAWLERFLADEAAHEDIVPARALLSLAGAHLFRGRLDEGREAAERLLRLGQQAGLISSTVWARMILGRIAYEQNDLATAERWLREALALRHAASILPEHDSVLGLALTLEASGRPAEATETVRGYLTLLEEIGNIPWTVTVEAFTARLALMQGDRPRATAWVRTYRTLPASQPYSLLERLPLTRAQILVATGTEAALEEAAALLVAPRQRAERLHHDLDLARVVLLEALIHHAAGRDRSAREAAKQALDLTRPGRLVRPFVDLGPAMATILRGVRPGTGDTHLARVLAAFPAETGDAEAGNPANALSRRERDVLRLLHRRLSNKEIAGELGISPLTVKHHTIQVYEKLGIGSRREAASLPASYVAAITTGSRASR